MALVHADTVNVYKRASVQRFYNRHFPQGDKAHFRWQGSADSPVPGAMSASFSAAMLNRLNYYRMMSGVPPMALDPNASAQAQLCAHLHASNPDFRFDEADPSLRFYTREAATACSICDTFWQVADTAYVINYWLSGATYYRSFPLSPAFTSIGLGGASSGSVQLEEYHFAATFAGNAPLQSRDGFVALPPPGYVPTEAFAQIEYLQFYATGGSDVDMTNCAVTLRINGRRSHTIRQTANDPRLLTITADRLFKIQNQRKLKNLVVIISGVVIDGIPQTYRWRSNFFKAAKN